MKTLYLDCGMGAAGDMLAAALLELLPDPQSFIDAFNRLAIPHVSVSRESVEKCGICGTHFSVTVNGAEEDEHMHEHHGVAHHHHGSLQTIEHIVGEHLLLEQAVRDDILAVYRLLAEAESHVHGVPISDIHFHEVGTMDALADITAVCMLLHALAPDEIIASPVHVGSGTVKCAHGILPVPAPAAAYLLRDVPIYGGAIQSELCTPTGAALLRHFVSRFGDMPVMKPSAIGYGMGKKDFDRANCLRAILGETGNGGGSVAYLNCNVDDMTGEEIGFAMERLYDAGALEVFTVAVGMKKNRPGTLIEVLCRETDRERIVETLFRHTTTIGVREVPMRRYVMARRTETLDTPYGTVRKKISSGYRAQKDKYEYDDLAKIAREQDIPLAEAKSRIMKFDKRT